MLVEIIEEAFLKMDEEDRPILELELQGNSVRQISATTGVRARTIYRILERVKGGLEREIAASRAAT